MKNKYVFASDNLIIKNFKIEDLKDEEKTGIPSFE